MMPPEGPRPDAKTYSALIGFLDQELDSGSEPVLKPPGMHRLNRAEYANAVRDLLGIEVDASEFLPADDSSNGFDNQAGSLTISPTLLEAYTKAAAKISKMAVGYWSTPTEMTYIVEADNSQNVQLEGMPFNTRGGIAAEHNFPEDGEYAFSMQNFGLGSYIPGRRAGADPQRLAQRSRGGFYLDRDARGFRRPALFRFVVTHDRVRSTGVRGAAGTAQLRHRTGRRCPAQPAG